MPTTKQASWWWLLGQVVVDWLDVPAGSLLYEDLNGKFLPTCTDIRVVYYDAYNHPQGDQKRSECHQSDAETPPQSELGSDSVCDVQVDSVTTDLPHPDYVLLDSGLLRHDRRRGARQLRKGRRQCPQKPLSEIDQLYWMDLSGLSDAHVSVIHSGADSADYYSSPPDTVERGTQVAGDNFTCSVYSVVQADEQFPECTHLREALISEFHRSVFTRKNYDEIDNSRRGDFAKVRLNLIDNPVPHSCKDICTVGVRKLVLAEKVKGFEERGWIQECKGKTEWVSRAFLVPKPNGKWRLVIEYGYLNTQLKGQNFPLPVIEEQIAKQQGNFIFSLIDLEYGFNQMHLEEECWHRTASITPFGVYEWKVLPMGVKVGPQVFQRLVQWVVRNCPFSDPYIDDVLTSTGHSCKYDPSARGKGKLFDSHALDDQSAFLQPCFSTPPVPPDGSPNPDMQSEFFYHSPESPSLSDQLYFHYLCLRELMQALASADLTVKPEKCRLLMGQVQYVGHVLREGQCFPSPAKTEALRVWDKNTIKTAKALKGFLGLANRYSMYIANYAKYAAPLMDALKGKYLYEDNVSTNSDCSGLPPKKRKRIRLTPIQAAIDWTPEMEEGFNGITKRKILATMIKSLMLPFSVLSVNCLVSRNTVPLYIVPVVMDVLSVPFRL